MIYETAVIRLSESGVKKRTIELIAAVVIGFICFLVYRHSYFQYEDHAEFFSRLFSQGIMIQCVGLVLMNVFSLLGHFTFSPAKPRSDVTPADIKQEFQNLTNRKSIRSPLPIFQLLGVFTVFVGFVSVWADGFDSKVSQELHIYAYIVLAIMVSYWAFHIWNRIQEFR